MLALIRFFCNAAPSEFQRGRPSETSFEYAFIVTAAYNARTGSIYRVRHLTLPILIWQ